jgi:hypothetical protein
MTGRAAAAVLALVVATAGLGLASPVSGAETDVAVQSVEVGVDQPAPGESVPLTITVANLQSSSGPVEVTDVFVRASGKTREYTRTEDVGTIAAGGTTSIPLSVSFESVGTKRLTVFVVVRDEDGDFTRVSYPLQVDVQKPDEALLSLSGLDLIAGQESRINVTVANGDDAALSNLRLRLSGDATVENPERVAAALASGSQRAYRYAVTPAEPGRQTLTAALTYKTSDGYTRTVERTTSVRVEPAVVDPELTASVGRKNGSSALRASLTEYGNAELRDVEVRVVADGETVARRLLPDVPEESTRTLAVADGDLPGGELTVVAEFTAAGERRSVNTTLQYSPVPTAAVSLTGVEATERRGVLTLSGDAANVGSADARSVVVSVVRDQGVAPVPPRKEYFVGAIDSSEFATFEVTANVSAGVESVPLRVEYTVDGERVSETVRVEVGDARRSPRADRGASGLPLLPIGVAVVVLAGLAGIGYAWRRR